MDFNEINGNEVSNVLILEDENGEECVFELLDALEHNGKKYLVCVPQVDMIGAIIGPGGKIIQEIQEKSGATISIEEIDGKGRVEIAATNKESLDMAVSRVKAIVAVPEVGEVYDAKVKSIMPYGAFVEFMPGKEGLLHISEIAWKRIEKMEDTGMKEGDTVTVKLLDIDAKSGKFKLSHKALLPKPQKEETEK